MPESAGSFGQICDLELPACKQLHGGYGFTEEYPISGDYQDAAVQTIYAGSNEIMKVIIARRLGLG